MSDCNVIWREGKLFEVSPFGTGFIEEKSTGRALGFHTSMIGSGAPRSLNDLEGQSVQFTVTEEGKVERVEIVTGSELRKPAGRKVGSQSPYGRKSDGDSKVSKSELETVGDD